MDSILPERLLALVRPGNDLVLRRIRSPKRCMQACGCKIMTPRYAVWQNAQQLMLQTSVLTLLSLRSVKLVLQTTLPVAVVGGQRELRAQALGGQQ